MLRGKWYLMKIIGIIFTLAGLLGSFITVCLNAGAGLAAITGSFAVLLIGISFLLSYVNFLSLNKMEFLHDCGDIYKQDKVKNIQV